MQTLEDLPRDAKLALLDVAAAARKGRHAESRRDRSGSTCTSHDKKDDNFLMRYQYASMLAQVDKREEALKEYERVVALEPRYDAGWLGLGETAYGLGQYQRGGRGDCRRATN